jgi:uncharacterized membrane protein
MFKKKGVKKTYKKKIKLLDKYTSDKNFFHKMFKISIAVKGIDSLLDIFAGIFLFFAKPEFFNKIIQLVFHYELIEDPHDFVVNFLINLFSSLSIGTQLFAAIYLLTHGLIKIGLVIGLWKEKIQTYILAEIVFFLFVVYQIYRFYFSHEVYLILLTLFDLIVIILTWVEYKQLKKGRK